MIFQSLHNLLATIVGNIFDDTAHLRKIVEKESKCSQEKSRGKKQHKEAIDLRALLIQCAQALTYSNCLFGSELLKKITLRCMEMVLRGWHFIL
jgi:hypothetical protein